MLLKLLDHENLRIYLHEIIKKKSKIKVINNIIRKLPHKLLKFFPVQKVVFMIEPSVIKVLFNFDFQLLFDELTSVESFEDSEEFSQVFAFVEILVKVVDLIQHIDKFAHYDGKDGDAKKHAEGNEETLCVAHWVEITESYSR